MFSPNKRIKITKQNVSNNRFSKTLIAIHCVSIGKLFGYWGISHVRNLFINVDNPKMNFRKINVKFTLGYPNSSKSSTYKCKNRCHLEDNFTPQSVLFLGAFFLLSYLKQLARLCADGDDRFL